MRLCQQRQSLRAGKERVEGVEMEMALIIIWGAALLMIVVLSVIVMLSQRRSRQLITPKEQKAVAAGLFEDTLLFYFEDQSVRSTAQGQLLLRIPGAAWDKEWQADLLRLEVSAQDLSSVSLPAEWQGAEVLAAFSLSGYRMTEMGNDVRIEQFAAPIDMILTADGGGHGLRCGIREDDGWILAPASALSPEDLGMPLPINRGWTAVSMARLRPVCLLRFPDSIRPIAGKQEAI